MSVTVYGASDDLIEVSGDISEEFDHYGDDPAELEFDDGTVLRLVYNHDGRWRITIVGGIPGHVEITHVAPTSEENPEDDDDSAAGTTSALRPRSRWRWRYSDRATLHGTISAVAYKRVKA